MCRLETPGKEPVSTPSLSRFGAEQRYGLLRVNHDRMMMLWYIVYCTGSHFQWLCCKQMDFWIDSHDRIACRCYEAERNRAAKRMDVRT